MANADVPDNQLRKGAKVVAMADLRDVPEGTKGKVILVNGLSWIRYWVRFDNGVSLGSLDRAVLATPAELLRRANGEDVAVAASTDAADAGPAAATADAGGQATPNGTMVPQRLLDRSAAARTRLAA